MNQPQILRPFDAAEAASITEAVAIAGVSDDTMRRWVSVHHLGRRIGGRWFVSRIALAAFLDGDKVALRALLAGDRDASELRPYVEAVHGRKKVAANTADAASPA